MANYSHFKVFPSNLEELTAVRDFVVGAVSELGGTEEDEFACELAVDEAVTNICKYAYPEAPGKIEIGFKRTNGDLFIHIRNYGRPFDPEAIPEPDLTLPLEERKAGGLGMFFMRQVMSQVEFQFDARQGNLLVLRRALGKDK